MVTFVVMAALAVAALAGIPLAAHLLRRGRAEEREFPPAALVPARPPIARRRSRLEDRLILALRIALIAALAVLGATPLVRCSRLSLAREAGASVALAIVMDDSLSMRATTPGGPTRWALAQAGARDLLRSAREGDAVAIVLGGAPSRLALAATTDLDAASQAIDELEPSDRPTDLSGAVHIARSALKQLPHVDKRVVLLSDLSAPALPSGEPPLWMPLDSLRQPLSNCGVVIAQRRARRVTATVACSAASAARGRRLQLYPSQQVGDAAPGADAATPDDSTRALGEVALVARPGVQVVALDAPASPAGLDARLTGSDALAPDDASPVAPESSAPGVAVVVDPATASVMTGGATVLEQAISALDRGATLRPLTLVPDDVKQLLPYSALILDDPPGLPAETRMALVSWVERGGVAVALLGPRAQSAQLGSTLEPFASGAVAWEEAPEAKGIDPASLSWLGNEATSLGALDARGRAELEGAAMPGAQVAGRWSDGRSWLLERESGRGLVLTVGLPVSTALSDVALRPGFLSLLDHIITQATDRAGPRRSIAGATWRFPAGSNVAITGPAGPVPLRDAIGPESDRTGSGEQTAAAELLGRYQVVVDGEAQVRFATADQDEITRQPLDPEGPTAAVAAGGVTSRIDASTELAMAVLALFALELLLRLAARLRRRVRARARA